MASGAGMYIMAAVGTGLIVVILTALDRVEDIARRRLDLPPEGYDLPQDTKSEGKSKDLP